MFRTIRRSTARYLILARKVRGRLLASSPRPVREMRPAAVAMPGIEGKVVLVTGSSRGIGLAIALAFARAGATVVIAARSQPQLDAVRESFAEAKARVVAIAADLAAPEGPERLVASAYARCSRIDILVNNAGTPGPSDAPVWEANAQAWDAVWRINVLAPAACAAAVIKRARKGQVPVRILNVSSGIAGQGAPRLGLYAVSKDALEGLTRALAADDTDGLVTAVSIQPRSVRTAMTRAYYDATTFALLDEADVVAPVFLWAAQAPAALVNGRSFSEPAFAASPTAASTVRGALAAGGPIRIAPATFSPGTRHFEAPGAYMHLMENAQGLYPAAAASLAAVRPPRALWAYPDPNYRALRDAIGADAGVPPSQIALSPGSSEMIDRALRMFCAPGDAIVITKPTWSFFHSFMQRWLVIPTEVPMLGSMREHAMRHDLDGLLRAISPRTRLLYLVNPCNPTGSVVSPLELRRFVKALPSHVVCIIDEAYVQYADPSVRPEVRSMIDSAAARVIVLRTFSKFFALSGLRVGYACASEETVQLLARAEIPFCVNSAAVAAVPAVLGDGDFRRKVFDDNVRGREQLYEGLSALSIPFQPSQTNFVLFECPTDPARLRADLLSRGVVLPNVDQFLRNYSVLTVGTREHNDLVLQALARY